MPLLWLGSAPPSDDEDEEIGDVAPQRPSELMLASQNSGLKRSPRLGSMQGNLAGCRTLLVLDERDKKLPLQSDSDEPNNTSLDTSTSTIDSLRTQEVPCPSTPEMNHIQRDPAPADHVEPDQLKLEQSEDSGERLRPTGNAARDGAAAIASVLTKHKPFWTTVQHDTENDADDEETETFEDFTKRQVWETGPNYGNLWQSDLADIRHWR
mmetsp:Transcript_27956/g.39274  ORF Transcript_27956/g.39274 Transcript_27956/m.39274 type:complete len:210 (+) Transcript_27956:133-762(+)